MWDLKLSQYPTCRIAGHVGRGDHDRKPQGQDAAATRRNPEAKAIMRALEAAAFELNAIGNNLNQIARALNTTGELRDWHELRDALDLFEKGETRHIAAVSRVLDL
jgi:hypothetical protein